MKQKQFLIIIILLLVFVIVWVGVNIYNNLNESTISEATSQEILPINPTFDIQTINKLKQRHAVNPAFELVNKIPLEAPISSSGSSLDTQPASQGGILTP